MLYCILGVFLLFRYLIQLLEKLVDRYFTATTTLLISDLSPVSPKNPIKREKKKLVYFSEREDFI